MVLILKLFLAHRFQLQALDKMFYLMLQFIYFSFPKNYSLNHEEKYFVYLSEILAYLTSLYLNYLNLLNL